MFRLLLVEDEYIEREAMKHIINQKFGDKFEIREAVNGLEAIEMAQTFKPHVIFLDIKMPGCSGIEAAKKIRSFSPDVKMIFITAYDYFDYAKEAVALHMDEFLLKPVDIDEVVHYLEKIIGGLEEEARKSHYKEKIQHDFSFIKKKFQDEFKALLLDSHTSKETIRHYMEIMDIKMKQAIIGLVDFTSIDQYESMSSIQKEFIKERFKNKLEQKCEAHQIITIIGNLTDLVMIVFMTEKGLEENERFAQELEADMKDCVNIMGLTITYQISEIIEEAGSIPNKLYEEKARLFKAMDKEKKEYPFEMEDALIEEVRKKEFAKAKALILKIVEYLQSEYEFLELKREFQGLYMLIERTMRRNASELLMPSASRHAVEVTSYIEMVNFYNRLFDYANEMLAKIPDKNGILIDKVCKYLEEHYNEDISLENAASMIGFSSFYFTKLIKEHMNMSYVEYITFLRIKKAKQLLEKTDLSVREISIEVGYENANYFTRVFKRVESMTPSQYKNKFMNRNK